MLGAYCGKRWDINLVIKLNTADGAYGQLVSGWEGEKEAGKYEDMGG